MRFSAALGLKHPSLRRADRGLGVLDLGLQSLQADGVCPLVVLRALELGLRLPVAQLCLLELLGPRVADLLIFPGTIEGLAVFVLGIVQGDPGAFQFHLGDGHLRCRVAGAGLGQLRLELFDAGRGSDPLCLCTFQVGLGDLNQDLGICFCNLCGRQLSLGCL